MELTVGYAAGLIALGTFLGMSSQTLQKFAAVN